MTEHAIGIDLGTTFSVVACIDDNGVAQVLDNSEGDYRTPSVIYFETPGNIVVGQVAKDARADEPQSVVEFVKRDMGTARTWRFFDQQFTAPELSAVILTKLKKDAEQALGGATIKKAVITVPAYFTAEKRDATEKAAKIAGIDVLALINEPTAAAMAFGMGTGQKNGKALVFDLGGGTFDVTLLQFKSDGSIDVLESAGDHELGGKDFDDKLMEIATVSFQQEHGYDITSDTEALGELRKVAQQAKEDLATRQKTKMRVFAGGFKSTIEVSRDQFEQAIAEYVQGMEFTLDDVLDSAEVQASDIDQVLMVGGSSRIVAVQQMVERYFGKKPTIKDPDKEIAVGAAYFAAKLLAEGGGSTSSHAEKVLEVDDIVPHSIGVTVLDSETGKEINSIVLPRKSKIPANYSNTYYTTADGQTEIQTTINEGEESDKDFVKEIGILKLQLKTGRPANSPIQVDMSIDRSGIIRVIATDKVDGTSEKVEVDYSSNMSESDVEIRKNWLTQQKIT